MRQVFKETPAGVRPNLRPEWAVAVLFSVAILLLHLFYLVKIGALWRDEVNSVNLAQGHLSGMSHDSFPILLPLLLRMWSLLDLGGTDFDLRLFGVLLGLSLTGAFWASAWLTRRAPPLWSLALAALNAWVIYYAASLRAYGLGSAAIVLCVGTTWHFLQKPSRRTWLYFAGAIILSVQSLYQNSALVAAICAGALAVCLRRKKAGLAAAIFLGGLAGAVSLSPYLVNIFGIAHAPSPLRTDFDVMEALGNLDTLLAFPLRQFFWVWVGLGAAVLILGGANCFSRHQDDLKLYAAVTLVFGVGLFPGFLWLARFPLHAWYFLPLVAFVAVCFDCSLPRPDGFGRAFLWGGLVATALISCPCSVTILDYRYTNVDVLAKTTESAARQNDFVIVAPWQTGITFSRYFKGGCAWDTVPPVSDHLTARYDLALMQMQNTNALRPLLEHVSATLHGGGTVWIVGEFADPGSAPLPLPPPPLPRTGWLESPYHVNWNSQMSWFVRRHSRDIVCVAAGTNDDVNWLERAALSKASGWRD